MGKNCAIPGCPNEKYNGKYLKGFGFPQDETMRKRWIEIIQMSCPGWIPTKYPRFCALHFDKNDIMDGRNNKLQFGAVPVYFNSDLKPQEKPKKEKISALIKQMNQNQLLYSSESECEYQIIVKVHKKPRKKNISYANRIRCVYCSMTKETAEEVQFHLQHVHGIDVDIMTTQDVLEYKPCVDEERNQMCGECGLVFATSPLDVINHIQTSHMEQSQIVYEEIPAEDAYVEEEYIFEEEMEDVKPVLVIPKEEEYEEEHEAVLPDPEPDVVLPTPSHLLLEENMRTTFKCRLCNADFVTKHDIKTHISEVHNAPQQSTNDFESHPLIKQQPMEVSSDDEPETYEPQCYLCEAVFTTLAKMRKHIRTTHKTEEYYYCSHCTGTFLSLDMYEDHECLEECIQTD